MGKGNFYPNLEVARGIAALSVALFHVGHITYASGTRTLIPGISSEAFTWSGQLFRVAGNGPGAVIFFYVLSGFVLTKVLHEKQSSNLAFAMKRLFRIYPAVLSTLLIYYVVSSFAKSPWIALFTEWNVFQNSTLLGTPIIGVMWSLQLEILAVPLLLLTYGLWRRYGFIALACSYVMLVGLSFTSTWNNLIGPPGQLGQIYAFLSGMAVCLYGERFIRELRRPKLWTIAFVVTFLVSRHIIGWSSYFTYLAEATFGAAILALLAFGLTSPNASWFRALRFLGAISFSFYLLHPLFLLFPDQIDVAVGALVGFGVPPLGIAALIFLVSTAIILPLAWGQYAIVEKTFIRLGGAVSPRPNSHPSRIPATTA